MESRKRPAPARAKVCSNQSCQQQLNHVNDKITKRKWHTICRECLLETGADSAAHTTQPKQQSEIINGSSNGRKRLIDYFNALGLAVNARASGKHQFLHTASQKLYEGVTKAVYSSTLPIERSDLRSAYTDPNCLQEEAESLISDFGFIWGDDNRRCAQNGLRVSQTDDRAVIKTVLRFLMARRIYKTRGYAIAKFQKQAALISSTSTEIPDSAPFNNYIVKGARFPDISTAPCEGDGPGSDDSELFGERKCFLALSPNIQRRNHITACEDPPLEASAKHQDDTKKDAQHIRDEGVKRLQKKKRRRKTEKRLDTKPSASIIRASNDKHSLRVSLVDRSVFYSKESNGGARHHSIVEGSFGMVKDERLSEVRTNSTLGQEKGLWVPNPTTTAPPENTSGLFKPEDEPLLRQMAFAELIKVLQITNPQGSTLSTLSDYVSCLNNSRMRGNMKGVLGNTLSKEVHKAMQLWHEMHARLQEFRKTTGYTGEAGAAWQAYKLSLRAISWKESLPAVAAHSRLGLFAVQSDSRREWVASRPDEFAMRVARFYATMLQRPNVGTEDLVDGFREYNVELLKWFEVGG